MTLLFWIFAASAVLAGGIAGRSSGQARGRDVLALALALLVAVLSLLGLCWFAPAVRG